MEKHELDEFHLDNIEDEDLKCSICHYYFTKNIKPYSLNCNHNLCLKCIDALIEKNMFNCPICRRSFSIEDSKNFNINAKYLDFITQILQLKYIFCIKCQKVFNFIEHFENCDQINFKDSNESLVDINNLAKDCLKLIKSSNRHLNILNNSQISIYEEIHRIMKIININFFEFFNKKIENFIEGIPKINLEELLEEIFNYLKFYELFFRSDKIETLNGNNKDQLNYWIENHINKLPFFPMKNGEATPFEDITTEILKFNFANYENFKEIKNSSIINLNNDKFIDSENDSEYDFNNFNSKKNNNEDSKNIASKYTKDNLNQIDILFNKDKYKSNEDHNKGINRNKVNLIYFFIFLYNINLKFKDLSSIKANKNHELYNSEEELGDENVNEENSPFKLNRDVDVDQTKNPLILSYNHYKLQSKNISDYNSKNINNKFTKENDKVRKDNSQMHNNEVKKYFPHENTLTNNTNNSKHHMNKKSNALSFSIDTILIKNFDKLQKNYIKSRKKSPTNFNTEMKKNVGIYSKDYSSIRSQYKETMKSESADSTYRNKKEKDIIKNISSNILDVNVNNINRKVRKLSENSNNTYVIDNYNFIDDFNNNNILSDNFSSISIEDINSIKRNMIREKNEPNSDTINKNEYGSENQNSQINLIKNNKNFSFKKLNKNNSTGGNEQGTIVTNSNYDSNFCERLNKSDNSISNKLVLSNENTTFNNKEKFKFNLMHRNINNFKNSVNEFYFMDQVQKDSSERQLHKVNKSKEPVYHQKSFENSYFNSKDNKNNYKEIDISQRQKIIVRNDQVKIIHNDDDSENQNKNMTTSTFDIKENNIRLFSNSPNTRYSNSNNNIGQINLSNKLEKEKDINYNKSQSNKIRECMNTSYIDKSRLDNDFNNKESNNHSIDKRKVSHSKLIDMNALYMLSRNTSVLKSQNLDEIKLNENRYNNNQSMKQTISVNSYSNNIINKTDKILYEKQNNIQDTEANRDLLIKRGSFNNKENQNEKIFNIAELKQRDNNKFIKFIKNSDKNENDVIKLTQYCNNRDSLQNEKELISNSPFKIESEITNTNKIINIQKFTTNNDNKIIGRDFQISNSYNSNNNKKNYSRFEPVSEFKNFKKKEQKNNEIAVESKNILIDNKKFDSFREMKISKVLNKHESFYELLDRFNTIKDKVFRIKNYSQQIELTSETLRDHISKNYSHLSEKIHSNLNSLCDNIIGTSSKNNYYKRIIPNIIENSKKICLFDIKLQTFEIKEFEYLIIKLNVSINIDHDGSDLIFLSGGKVNNNMNFFKGEESFGDLSGQITALFLILRWSTKAIEVNGQLLRKRAWHSSLYYNNKLYIIGGASSESLKLKECECYNIIQKQWELLPNLNYARCNPGLCIYNQEYLYVFNGWAGKNCFLDTIEFININHFSSSSWSMYKPEDPGLSWEGFSNCCAAVAAENRILIFGGYRDDKDCKTYFFDPLKKIVFRGKDLVKSSMFYNNALFFENKIYSVDNKNENRKIFGVHVYEIGNNLWKYYQGP